MVKYYIPENLDAALKALRESNFLPYAGGTDINSYGIEKRDLLFIGKLKELKEIKKTENYISIGAGVTYAEAEHNELVPEIMRTAIRKVASPAVRNLGTFGGNLANGSGKADSALVDIVLDAKLRIRSCDSERFAEVKNFYRGRKEIDLKPDELITEILIPDREYYTNYFYDKVSVRSSIAISNVTVASVWKTEGGRVEALSIGIGSATDYPQRCTDIENELVGKTFEEIEENSEEILGRYMSCLELPPDRTCADYRRQVCFRLLNYLICEEFTPIHIY